MEYVYLGSTGLRVVWLSDRTRPFVIVLIETGEPVGIKLGGYAHLGVGCASREEVDRYLSLAREEGRKTLGPNFFGPPVGYWGFISDPDGHNLELSYGQEVNVAAEPVIETVTA